MKATTTHTLSVYRTIELTQVEYDSWDQARDQVTRDGTRYHKGLGVQIRVDRIDALVDEVFPLALIDEATCTKSFIDHLGCVIHTAHDDFRVLETREQISAILAAPDVDFEQVATNLLNRVSSLITSTEEEAS